MLGASSASPAAMTRMADRSSSGGRSLSMNPLAPTRSAPKTYSSRSNVVRISTRGSGPAAVIRRVASIPSSTGMRMSMQHHVGRGPAGHRDRFRAVGGLAEHGQVGLGVDEHAEPGPDDGLVVGDYHADGHATRPTCAWPARA